METVTILEICALFGVSRVTILKYRREDPKFPKPRRCPKNPLRFDRAEIIEYFHSK